MPCARSPSNFFGLFVRSATCAPEVRQHRGGDVVRPRVVGEPEDPVRIDRVVPLLLERVRADLVAQADPAPLLPEVDDHARARPPRWRASRESSWSRQSHLCERRTSPVQHSECTRTSGASAPPAALTSPDDERDVLLAGLGRRPSARSSSSR